MKLSDLFKKANEILKKKGMTDEQVNEFWEEEIDTEEPFSGVPYVVLVYNCNDNLVCATCRSIEGEHLYKYRTEAEENGPKVPYEKCTSEGGCRCWSTITTSILDADKFY